MKSIRSALLALCLGSYWQKEAIIDGTWKPPMAKGGQCFKSE
jgi:hypothetical protein